MFSDMYNKQIQFIVEFDINVSEEIANDLTKAVEELKKLKEKS